MEKFYIKGNAKICKNTEKLSTKKLPIINVYINEADFLSLPTNKSGGFRACHLIPREVQDSFNTDYMLIPGPWLPVNNPNKSVNPATIDNKAKSELDWK